MIIDGKAISGEIIESVFLFSQELKSKGVSPGLAVILAGDDPASSIYVNNKIKACERAGIYSEVYRLSGSAKQSEVEGIIDKLNQKSNIHGILVQLPLPKHINVNDVIGHIGTEKDVDAFSLINSGKLMQGTTGVLPCTPGGIMEMFKYEGISVEGKNCVVIGRSNIVGKPMAMILLNSNATVTVCHSKTVNLPEICSHADILISAAGKAGLVTSDMVKEGAVVIDVGMNRDSNGKLCGDVQFDAVKDKASYITPVPGGVGPMTIAMLMKNTVMAARFQSGLS